MTPAKNVTVVVADDHAAVRASVCALLNADGHFTIVGQAANGREAVTMARGLVPDVVLMDISMPVLNGLEATRQIIAGMPSARVIILSAYNDDEYLERARAVGAIGMLAKQAFSETLVRTVREVAAGGEIPGPSAFLRPSSEAGGPPTRHGRLSHKKAAGLSARESEVLQLLAVGNASRQVATLLHISLEAVEGHLERLMHKLKVRNVADLARFAIVPAVADYGVELTII